MVKNSKEKKIEFVINGNKKITNISPTFIIAEIGINHEGNFKMANNLVSKAFQSGADAVKFQIVNPEHSYGSNTLSYNLYKASQLTEKNYQFLINKFNHKGLIFATLGDL